MRSIFSVLMGLCLLCASASAQDAQWSDVHEGEGSFAIHFGVPETDDAQIFLTCTKQNDAVEFSWHADVEKPAGMKTGADGMRARLEGQTVELRFADGDKMSAETVTNAAYQPEEMYGAIFVEFSLSKSDPIVALFRQSSDAALVIPGAEPQTLDLKGADAAIGKLLKACGG